MLSVEHNIKYYIFNSSKMSKLNSELLTSSVENILKFAQGETINYKGEDLKGKKRKFIESIELQVHCRFFKFCFKFT